MPDPGSISHWLDELKLGHEQAAQPLWERYFKKLVFLAKQRLHGLARRSADEEDVALSVFDSFFRGVAQARYPQLNDRHDLWRLLLRITANKSTDLIRRETCQKRGGFAEEGDGFDWTQVSCSEPSPELAAQAADELDRLLRTLDEKARQIAVWKMEGFTTAEIATKLGCTERTVERKLCVIRSIWLDIRES